MSLKDKRGRNKNELATTLAAAAAAAIKMNVENVSVSMVLHFTPNTYVNMLDAHACHTNAWHIIRCYTKNRMRLFCVNKSKSLMGYGLL